MLSVYLNYPNSIVSVHGDASCATIGQMGKVGQRHVRIDARSRVGEMARFAGSYRFASKAELNDMWVVVSLANRAEEERVVVEIKQTLGRRYGPFLDAQVEWHC